MHFLVLLSVTFVFRLIMLPVPSAPLCEVLIMH